MVWNNTKGWNAWPWSGNQWQTAGWIYPTDIPAAESAALKAFYDATGGAGWTTKTNWGTSATAANWYGVTVAGGHVTKIELNNNGLTGNAGTTLNPLAAVLLTLKVGGTNALTGITLTALTALTNLDASNCTLTQAQIDAVLLMLDTAAASGGAVTISGNNAAPSASGLAYATSLQQKTWTVTTSATVTLAETLTAGDLKIATVNGSAMLFRDGKDYSPYAGTDAGSTPYLIEMCDSAGKVAYAYAGAAGAGEAVGSDVFAGWNFTSGWLTAGTVTINDADTFTTGQDNGGVRPSVQSLTVGKCYKFVFSSDVADMIIVNNVTGLTPIIGVGSGTFYYTATLSYYMIKAPTSGTVATVASQSAKPLTDVPTTGLHLMSAKNGTTRNMSYVETGFNPNAITLLRVYPAP